MTFRTIGCHTVFYKLFVMIISMTISTTIVLQRICKFCFMTCFAIYYQMFFFQLKISFIMIEILQSANYLK